MLARPTGEPAGATLRSMKPQPVPVLVVDDLASFRRAAAAVIAVTNGFVLAGEAGSGEEAIALLEERPVGLVLLDINMPGMGGLQAAEQIRRRFPDVMVVLLSVLHLDDLPPEALSSGVRCCHKDRFGPDELEALWAGGNSAPTSA
jgi:two-component system, NarL family, invasion response regulator UvrY